MEDNQSILVSQLMFITELLATFAYAVSGIRQASTKQFDWFGGLTVGFVVAIGGGTVRDILLGVTPFWMTNPLYIICTIMAQVCILLFGKLIRRLNNAWLIFDTLGLALYTIVGMQKTIDLHYPFWVAIIMGTITGCAGGIIRDVLLNNTPVIFHKEIYAMASVIGGAVYCTMFYQGTDVAVCASTTFIIILLIRFLSIRFHLSLPHLHSDDGDGSDET